MTFVNTPPPSLFHQPIQRDIFAGDFCTGIILVIKLLGSLAGQWISLKKKI